MTQAAIYDGDGKLTWTGQLDSKVSIPVTGSLSLLINGYWLNILTSEWMIIRETEAAPHTWKDEHDFNRRERR